MNIALNFQKDEWGRSSLSTVIHTDDLSRILTFARFGNDIWWAKSPLASTDHAYSVQYHHVHDATKRQVIVTCGSVIQNCVIPTGYDPESPITAVIEMSTPSTIYQSGLHSLGVIIIPKADTSTLRNRIWRIKASVDRHKLILFSDALAHGRTGHFRSENEKIA